MKIAGNFNSIIGEIAQPSQLNPIHGNDPTGATGINNLLSNTIQLFYMVSSIVFVVMILWAAYDFIVSHGEKESINKARSKITWAVIGMVFLGISFVLFRVIQEITGVPILVQ